MITVEKHSVTEARLIAASTVSQVRGGGGSKFWPVECGGQENVKVNLNNRIRRHGLSACQIHFPRDQNTGENLPIQDSKLQEVREARKEASPRHQAVTTPCPQPDQQSQLLALSLVSSGKRAPSTQARVPGAPGKSHTDLIHI